MTAIVLRGDAAHLPLPDGSVDLICTSPPYFGQRDYRDGGESMVGQIGSEVTPSEYVAALVSCTREWMRALKPSGSLFINLGDKYSSAPSVYGVANKSLMGLPWRYAFRCMDDLGLILRAEIIWRKNGQPESVRDRVQCEHEHVFHFTRRARYYSGIDEIRRPLAAPGRKAGGSAFGARDANHLRVATGAYDGQNPLGKIPGSVWDIPTEPLSVPDWLAHARCCGGRKRADCEDGLAHHAAWPRALVREMILGWSPSGICTECGEGRRPRASAVALDMSRPQARRAHQIAERAGLTEEHFAALLSVGVSDTGRGAATQDGTGKNTSEVYALADEARAVLGGYAREYLLRRPTGFGYACACPDASAPTRPAVVADPFGGTGTTALVADVLGRTGYTFDLSADYCRLAEWRTTDPAERARALGVPKPPPVPEGQRSLFDLEAS